MFGLTKKLGRAERLCERVEDWRNGEIQVDRAERVVRNVALAGTISRNGYRYAESALERAIGLYEGRPVFLDHAVDAAKPQQRSARDLIGAIRNARFERGRIRGDIEVLGTDCGQTFLELAEANASSVGMSHVVLAVRSADKQVVERIEEVISVDVVVFPATTQTLQESADATAQDGPPELSCEQLRGRYERLINKYVSLRRRMRRQRTLDEMLRAAKLPADAVTEQFRELLASETDESRQLSLIEERARLWQRVEGRTPGSFQRLPDAVGVSDEAFVRVLKG